MLAKLRADPLVKSPIPTLGRSRNAKRLLRYSLARILATAEMPDLLLWRSGSMYRQIFWRCPTWHKNPNRWRPGLPISANRAHTDSLEVIKQLALCLSIRVRPVLGVSRTTRQGAHSPSRPQLRRPVLPVNRRHAPKGSASVKRNNIGKKPPADSDAQGG